MGRLSSFSREIRKKGGGGDSSVREKTRTTSPQEHIKQDTGIKESGLGEGEDNDGEGREDQLGPLRKGEKKTSWFALSELGEKGKISKSHKSHQWSRTVEIVVKKNEGKGSVGGSPLP